MTDRTLDNLVKAQDTLVTIRVTLCAGYISDPIKNVKTNENHAYIIGEQYSSGRQHERIVSCSNELRAQLQGVKKLKECIDRTKLETDTRKFYMRADMVLAKDVRSHYPHAELVISKSSGLCTQCHDAHREVFQSYKS